jgi:hypothetical protein
MKKKFNPELLKEELNKFRLLSEYDFYTEKKEEPTYMDDKELVLGNKALSEVDEEPADNQAGGDMAGADMAGADMAGADMAGANMAGGEEETTSDIPEPDAMDAEAPIEEPAGEESPIEEPAGDEVEVDVTSLVKGSEEAKQSADKATQNTEMLLQKLTDLESRLANMTAITNKIENLEQEIIKRNPTPVEKLEMRSLSSYPFNQKITDYWADKEGAYDVMNTGNKEPKEYVLKKDDVDASYSDASIQKSFTADTNDYDEEDISDYYEENL